MGLRERLLGMSTAAVFYASALMPSYGQTTIIPIPIDPISHELNSPLYETKTPTDGKERYEGIEPLIDIADEVGYLFGIGEVPYGVRETIFMLSEFESAGKGHSWSSEETRNKAINLNDDDYDNGEIVSLTLDDFIPEDVKEWVKERVKVGVIDAMFYQWIGYKDARTNEGSDYGEINSPFDTTPPPMDTWQPPAFSPGFDLPSFGSTPWQSPSNSLFDTTTTPMDTWQPSVFDLPLFDSNPWQSPLNSPSPIEELFPNTIPDPRTFNPTNYGSGDFPIPSFSPSITDPIQSGNNDGIRIATGNKGGVPE